MMDPTRLRDDPNLAVEQRALLDLGREAYPYDVAAGAVRFRTSLAALGAAAAVSTASTTAQGAASIGGKVAAKTLASIVLPLIGVVGAGALFVATRTAPSPETPRETPPPANVDVSRPAVAPAVSKAIPFEALPQLPAGTNGAEDGARIDNVGEGAPGPARHLVHERAGEPSAGTRLANGTSGGTASNGHALLAAAETSSPNARESSPNAAETSRPHAAAPAARDERPQEDPAPRVESKPEESAPKPPEPAPRAQSETATEMLTIARARQLLASNPGAALSLLEAERKVHPRGLFAEERSALTIIALAKTGNLALARAQAKVFIGAHPRGPLTDQVRTATGL
jgi:hypothetical protein